MKVPERPRIAARLWACLLVVVLGFPAFANDSYDPRHFTLSAGLLDRMQALEAQTQGLVDESDETDAESVQDLVQRLEADPRVRALLARHRIGSREFAAASLAILHAGLYLATEPLTDDRSRAAALASFTPQQRANITLLRTRMKP